MFTTINGYKFYYHESGIEKTNKTPILFIHGLGSSTLDWEQQIPFFEQHYKVFSIDLRGHGKTEGTEGKYSIPLFAEDIASFLMDRKIKVHIIAISMGGMIAFQLAADHPILVKSMVIINSSVELLMDNPKVRKGIRFRKILPRIVGMKRMGRMLGKKVFPYENQTELRELIAARWATNPIKDYIKSVTALAGWTIKNRLHEINCSILVVGAENDYSTEAEKQEYTDLLSNASLIIVPNTGHAISMEKPTVLNPIIFNFLENK